MPRSAMQIAEFVGRPVKEDLEAVNSSIDIIRKTRGGSWPEGELSEDFNWRDLVWHERENDAKSSFAYAVRDAAGEYTGCFYLYPVGYRAALSQDGLQYGADASWWVTTKAYEKGEYEVLYHAVVSWLENELSAVGKPLFSNLEIPSSQQ